MKISCTLIALIVLLRVELPATDVAFYGIIKSQHFSQSQIAAPTALSSNGFGFNALVLAAANNVVTNATVKPSTMTSLRQLIPQDANNSIWRFEQRFNSQSALDAVYPNGNIITAVRYTNTMHTVNDGIRALTLDFSLAALGGSPPVPQINNFGTVQAIDTTDDFTLRFNLSGGTFASDDIVQMIISDTASNIVFATPEPFSPGSLTGASNSVVIPAYTLPAGASLVGHLTFARPLGLNSNYVGTVGVAAVLKDTEFPVVTRPAPIRPVLEVVTAGPPFQLRYKGETNRVYRIQGTADFQGWTDLLVTNPPAAVGVFSDAGSDTRPWRFFRVQVGL